MNHLPQGLKNYDSLAMLNAQRTTADRPWPIRESSYRSSFLKSAILTILFCFLFFFSYYSLRLSSLLSVSYQTHISHISQCASQSLFSGGKFLWYAPHSGFSNQLSEFKNALLIAGILNRTLIVPPILDHHAIALGSCPKFRILSPNEIRKSVWDHIIELILTGRYISIVDIIDISSLVSSSTVQVIDYRLFVSLWCNLNADIACINKLNARPSLHDSLKQCGSLLSGLDGNVDKCLYAVDVDCRTTVWTYQHANGDGTLDPFQPDEQLKKKKKFSYVRWQQDVYKTLGPGSEAESATVLAFGSLFSAPYRGSELYIDIHEAPRDKRIQNLIKKIEFLPFVPDIMEAGKKFAHETIKAPFICAQLRLLDGQFKNHRKTTFLGLKEKVESLRQSTYPIHIFVMTDLPEGNWTGSYLEDLTRDSQRYQLFFLKERYELVLQTANRLLDASRDLSFGFSAKVHVGNGKIGKSCHSLKLPDVLLYIEEAICSCASLGFIGTYGSTIGESIDLMRKFGVCSN